MTAIAFSSNETAVLTRTVEVEDKLQKTPKELVPEKYDLQKCIDWIRTRQLEKVCLQFPDSLLPDSFNIAIYLEKGLGRKVYILGDTSYGSCCIDEVTAEHIGADAIIHFGHACLNPTIRLPIYHVLPRKEIDVKSFCEDFEKYFDDCTVALLFFYDVTYAHAIETIYDILKPKYKNLVLTSLNCISNVEYTDKKDDKTNVILGRSWTLEEGRENHEYEMFFLGSNGKTLSNLAMTIPAKKWFYSEGAGIKQFEALNTPWLKRRRFLVEKLKDAKIVAIVVATLGIKNYLSVISSLKSTLKKVNKKTYTLCVGKINPPKLANFAEMDAFVVIACPESEIFDSRDFQKPLLLPYEVDLAFNSCREFSQNYCMDFNQILPGGVNYVDFEASTEPDTSLISGGVRGSKQDEPSITEMNTVACKSDGTVAVGKAGASFLQERSWKGLEQRLGQDEVKPVEKGRSGIPLGYQNEPKLINSQVQD